MKGFIKNSLWVGFLLLAGCSTVDDYVPGYLRPYRPDVHQGNVVTSEMTEALREGMTKNQVIFLLGSPTLRSTFHENEWDYIYYLNPRIGKVQIRKLQIIFDEDGRVGKIIADEMPNETDADLLILGSRARDPSKRKAKKPVEETPEETETTVEPETTSEPVPTETAEQTAEDHPNKVEEWEGLKFPVEED
ncbi:MAG: outer membrane protein assembly factor BamE [Burkholderiales bacterium]|nr:outer membrane protein assembly factor BamE [Burkholderiales bacterium]